MQIGELLIREGHLTQDGLEEALDWQVLYGGRLGTNLLELQLVEEKQLALALGKQLGCETAWGEIQLAHEMIGLIPDHVADRQEMVPWKQEKRRIKVLCTEIKLDRLDQLSYKLGHPCIPVVAPEFRIFNLLRAHYKATRQLRALDFGVVPEEGLRRRKAKAEQKPEAPPPPELIDEDSFNAMYNSVLSGRGATAVSAEAPQHSASGRAAAPASSSAPASDPAAAPVPASAAVARSGAAPATAARGGTASAPPPPAEVLEALPEDAILGDAGEPAGAAPVPLRPVQWEPEPAPAPRRDERPLAFDEALRLLEGVTDRDSIAHIVLRASRAKAARALLMTVQAGVALGWDGLGEGVEGAAARGVAVPLKAQSAFQLVVQTRSHFMGPLQKTPSNIRFLAATGKQIPSSSLLFPILYRGRVSHLLYLDNGHRQQAPTDVGEMLILSQRIAQSVEALVLRKRQRARG